jgi:hypothetical protein
MIKKLFAIVFRVYYPIQMIKSPKNDDLLGLILLHSEAKAGHAHLFDPVATRPPHPQATPE